MNPVKKKFLIVMLGPTASGKTSLSIQLARHFQTEIISADSRQFYREMNIGTAKPTAKEMEEIPHHLIDFLNITEEYSVGKFEKDALECLEEIYTRKETALLAGGSGLYVKALCEGLDQMPVTSEKIRQQLNSIFQQEGLGTLLQKLQELDPEYYNVVDKNNPQRIIRALEVCLSSDRPFSSFRIQKKAIRPFQSIKIGLEWPRKVLYERIEKRMDEMIAGGLLEEAKSLYWFRQFNALQTVGYSEIFDFLEGKYDWPTTIELLKRNSRRYAKRQLTWFKKDKEIRWFAPENQDEIISYLREQMEQVN